MNQNNVIIKCPQCGARFGFKPVPNYKMRTVACPKCGFTAQVTKYEILFDPAAAPAPAQNTTDDESTQFPAGNKAGAPKNPASGPKRVSKPTVAITCLDTGEKFILAEGKNTLGRKAKENKARFVFTDRNNYMSRLHAAVTLIYTPSGIQLQLNDEGSANGTFIGTARLKGNAIIRLDLGKTFKMGELTFKCIEDDDEATQLS